MRRDLYREFLVHLQSRQHTARTVDGYRSTLRRFREFLEERGIESPLRAESRDLSDFQTEVLLGRGREGHGLKAGTQSNLLGQVRMFYRYLVTRGLLLINPAEAIHPPKCPRQGLRRNLAQSEMKTLLLAPDVTDPLGLRDRAILEVLYGTGMRITELLSLDVVDVLLAEEEVSIRRGKGKKSRHIPLGLAACRWVERYLKDARSTLIQRVTEKALFLSCRGKRMDRANLARIVREYGQKAGLKSRVTAHVIRHSFATHMLRGKASLRHIQDMLGHAWLSTTQIYTHVEISDLKETHRRCHPRGRRG